MQLPFNPKDWSVSLPASIFGLGFLIYMFVWAAKQLHGINGLNGSGRKEDTAKKLTAEQREEVRLMIESMVVKRGEKGGLHWVNNQITRWLWEEEDKPDRRKNTR